MWGRILRAGALSLRVQVRQQQPHRQLSSTRSQLCLKERCPDNLQTSVLNTIPFIARPSSQGLSFDLTSPLIMTQVQQSLRVPTSSTLAIMQLPTHGSCDTSVPLITPEWQMSSTLKKRRLKMNRHKYRKRKKRDRRRNK